MKPVYSTGQSGCRLNREPVCPSAGLRLNRTPVPVIWNPLARSARFPSQPGSGLGQPGFPANRTTGTRFPGKVSPVSRQPASGLPVTQVNPVSRSTGIRFPGQVNRDPVSRSGQPGFPVNRAPVSRSGQPGFPVNRDPVSRSGQPGFPVNRDPVSRSGGFPVSQPGFPVNRDPVSRSGQPGFPVNRDPVSR